MALDGVDNHVQADSIDSDMGNGDVTDTSDIGDGQIHHIETRNDDLAGEHHPVTGVEFESKIVTLPTGEVIEGVFPDLPFFVVVYEIMQELSIAF
jgi:hypothetical protein